MSVAHVVAEYCRAARIFSPCMVYGIIHNKYASYEYDADVDRIAMKIYHMLVVYHATEEEIVEALEGLKLEPSAYGDVLEILGEFFVRNAATIYTHLQMMAAIQKN